MNKMMVILVICFVKYIYKKNVINHCSLYNKLIGLEMKNSVYCIFELLKIFSTL